MGKGTNRRKGHDAERYFANEFKDLGFGYCVTARYGSRQHDDAGIDLINLPHNVQIKAGKQKAMNPGNVLRDIKQRIVDMFAPDSVERLKPTILIWRKEVGRGKKRDQFDDLVIMSFEDYKKIIKEGEI